MNGKVRNEHEAPCPRCGEEAQWSFLDANKDRIEVLCPNCGRYEMSRQEFDQAAVDSAEIGEADR